MSDLRIVTFGWSLTSYW